MTMMLNYTEAVLLRHWENHRLFGEKET